MERALGRVAPGGRVVFVGHTPGPLEFANPVLHGKELELVASRNALRSDFETVFAALRSGAVDPTAWITTRTDPDGFAATIAEWVRPSSGIVKAIVDWTDEAFGGRPAAARDGR
jgi:threonine dehydrogenase-like Zn-dependent dehydrogenase